MHKLRILLIIINKLINCFQFSPVSFQRKPLEGLQVQSPETSMRERSAPTEFRTLDLLMQHNVLRVSPHMHHNTGGEGDLAAYSPEFEMRSL